MVVEPNKRAMTGAFITGALGTGLLASCCGIPLLLGAVGLGASGATLVLSTWRYPLLVLCLVSTLASGIFLLRRRAACDAGCAERSVRRARSLVIGGVAASLLMGGAGILFANPANEQSQRELTTADASQLSRIEIPVRGMSCAGCAEPIKAALSHVTTIEQFGVDISRGLVRFSVNDSQIDMKSFRRAIEALGYTSEEPRLVAR